MADDDLIEQGKALKARAEAVRTDAATLRKQVNEEFQRGATEKGVIRDRAERAKAVADHVATEADKQVEALQGTAAANRRDLDGTEAEIAAAVEKGQGDSEAVQELRERADGYRQMIGESDARVHAARMDAAAAREGAGTAARTALEAGVAYDEHYDAVTAAERQIDLIERQAGLIEDARMKLLEAEIMYGGDPPADADMNEWVTSKAALEVAAEDLIKRADAITVDRSVIAVIVPTADDVPTAGEALPTNDTELMDKNDGDAVVGAAAFETDGDALGLDLIRDEPDTPADTNADPATEPATTDHGEADGSTMPDFPNSDDSGGDAEGTSDLPAAEWDDGTADADFLTGATPDLADPQTEMWDPSADDGSETAPWDSEPSDGSDGSAIGDVDTGDGFGADGF